MPNLDPAEFAIPDDVHLDLNLAEHRVFDNGIAYLRYLPRRGRGWGPCARRHVDSVPSGRRNRSESRQKLSTAILAGMSAVDYREDVMPKVEKARIRKRGRLVAIMSSLLLAIGGVVAGTTAVSANEVSATSCYGGAKVFNKPYGGFYVPSGQGKWKTTGRCNDINIKITGININEEVRVCFYPSSGGMQCQRSYKTVGDEWMVLASNVRTGTKFKLQFRYKYALNLDSAYIAY